MFKLVFSLTGVRTSTFLFIFSTSVCVSVCVCAFLKEISTPLIRRNIPFNMGEMSTHLTPSYLNPSNWFQCVNHIIFFDPRFRFEQTWIATRVTRCGRKDRGLGRFYGTTETENGRRCETEPPEWEPTRPRCNLSVSDYIGQQRSLYVTKSTDPRSVLVPLFGRILTSLHV